MTEYKTKFYRMMNHPPYTEDWRTVKFLTDISFEDETLEEFEAVAWEEMWKQNPDFRIATSGWTSVMSNMKYEKVV